MKKSIKQKKQETQELYAQIASLIGKWQGETPAKRKAVFILADYEKGEYRMGYAVNKRRKYPTAEAASAFIGPMRDDEGFFGGMSASVRFIRREKIAEAKATKKLPIQMVEFREQDEIKSE